MIPDHVKSQFAGNMGIVSIGAGYTFFDGKLETDMFYGYVGGPYTKHFVHHLTQKNTFSPFLRQINSNISWRPVTLGMSFLYNIHDNNRQTWLLLPERYPKRYYMATAFSMLITMGTAVTWTGNGPFENVGIYIEGGTTALALRNWIYQDYIDFSEIVSLGIGISKSFN